MYGDYWQLFVPFDVSKPLNEQKYTASEDFETWADYFIENAAASAQNMYAIYNAAKEPHIVDLANFLNSMGAKIKGAGTDVIRIRGQQYLHSTTYAVIPDQIETGTLMIAAAATGGDVLITGAIPTHMEALSVKLLEMGVDVEERDDAVLVRRNAPLHRTNVKTMPYPGFPTDMQPQIAVLLSIAEGTSSITEGVWDNRFRYIEQLTLMGADAQVDGKTAVIQGVDKLYGAPVAACDLRAGAAMVIAGLIANGETVIEDIYHIQRGYEKIVEKLTNVGADIKIINE